MDVALKIFAPDTGMDTQGLENFKDEFRMMFNLNHTNVLHISHYDVYAGRPYIILPLCNGGSAVQFIGKASEELVWQFLEQVASGLDYLHSQQPKIIHQDIKPANILINENGQFLITDFGISLRMHETIRRTISAGTVQEQEKAQSGTVAYMGPERFEKKPRTVMASDIWSLGASAYELLENDVPFGEYGGETQRSTQAGLPGLVGKVPAIKAPVSEELKNLIYSCLAENTWERPTAKKIVEICRNRHQKPAPIESSPAPSEPIPAPPPHRRWWWIAVSVVALIAFATLWMFLDKRPSHGPIEDFPSNQYEVLFAEADSILSIMKEQTSLDNRLVQGSEVSTQLQRATEKYASAIKQMPDDDAQKEAMQGRLQSMQAIVDSCQVLNHLADTIGELYNEGRVVTADEFKIRQEQLSKTIKKQIAEL